MHSSIEIIRSALSHKEPARLPLDIGGTRVTGIHKKAYSEYRKRLGLPETEPEMKIRYLQLPVTDIDFSDMLGTDIESADPLTSAEETEDTVCEEGRTYTDRWGCVWHLPESGNYYDIVDFPLSHAEDVSDISSFCWPAEDSEAILANLDKKASEVLFERKRALVLGRTCPGIYEMLQVLCGYEKAFTDLAGNPELSEAVLEKMLELKIIYYDAAIRKIMALDPDYFIISESDDLGAQNGLLISPDMYRRLVKPRHTKLFEFIKKASRGRAYIELHCCGAIREIIPDLIESGVEILNPVQVSARGMDDTGRLKKDFGKDIVFHGGGIDSQHTLPCGKPQEVRDEVRRRIDDLAAGGGFIFTPVHSIQHDVPFENFYAMIEAYREAAGI